MENNFFSMMEEDELQTTNGGVIGTVLTVAGLCIAGYGLLREMVKDKGRADAINGK